MLHFFFFLNLKEKAFKISRSAKLSKKIFYNVGARSFPGDGQETILPYSSMQRQRLIRWKVEEMRVIVYHDGSIVFEQSAWNHFESWF